MDDGVSSDGGRFDPNNKVILLSEMRGCATEASRVLWAAAGDNEGGGGGEELLSAMAVLREINWGERRLDFSEEQNNGNVIVEVTILGSKMHLPLLGPLFVSKFQDTNPYLGHKPMSYTIQPPVTSY